MIIHEKNLPQPDDEPLRGVRSVDLRLEHTLQQALSFMEALREVRPIGPLSSLSGIQALIEPAVFQKIVDRGTQLGFTEPQVEQFARQKLYGNFHILNEFLGYTGFTEQFLYSREQLIQRTLTNLDKREKAFFDQVSSLNPLIAANAALFLGLLKDQPESRGSYDNSSMRMHYFDGLLEGRIFDVITKLDRAEEAFRAVDRVATRLKRAFSGKNFSDGVFIDAWRNDLVRPIVEAVAHITADGMHTIAHLHSTSVTWYGPHFPMPNDRGERSQMVDEWRLHTRNRMIPEPLFSFLGFETAESIYRSTLMKRSSLPLIGFIGKNDCFHFVSWMTEVFQGIEAGLDSHSPRDISQRREATNVRLDQNLAFLFRKEENSGGQARFAISYGRGDSQVSIRVDHDRSGLSLDFGTTSALDMMRHLRHSCASCEEPLKRERALVMKLGKTMHRHPSDVQSLLTIREELSQNADRLSFFGAAPGNPAIQMPYLATMLVASGQLLGTRSPLTISHHWRESTHQVLGAQESLSRSFANIVEQLKRGIAYTRL